MTRQELDESIDETIKPGPNPETNPDDRIQPGALRVVYKQVADYADQKGQVTFFRVGDGKQGTPPDGATTLILPAMKGRRILYDCSNGGPLEYNTDFKRINQNDDPVTGNDPQGDVIVLLSGGLVQQFLTGDRHRITLL